jgi:hypothetical protein
MASASPGFALLAQSPQAITATDSKADNPSIQQDQQFSPHSHSHDTTPAKEPSKKPTVDGKQLKESRDKLLEKIQQGQKLEKQLSLKMRDKERRRRQRARKRAWKRFKRRYFSCCFPSLENSDMTESTSSMNIRSRPSMKRKQNSTNQVQSWSSSVSGMSSVSSLESASSASNRVENPPPNPGSMAAAMIVTEVTAKASNSKGKNPAVIDDPDLIEEVSSLKI